MFFLIVIVFLFSSICCLHTVGAQAVEAEPVVCDGAARRVVDVLQETILEVNVHQVEHCATPRAHKVRVRFRVAVEALEAADRSDRDDQTFVLEHGQVPVDRAEA